MIHESAPSRTILLEEQAWERAAERFLGPGPELLAVSRWIPDSRVYCLDNRIAVIRSLVSALDDRVNSLRRASQIMTHLGLSADYRRVPPWEVLESTRIAGSTLESRMEALSFGQRIWVLTSLIAELRKLHKSGVAHRDLRADNILIEPCRSVHLIDFDQAVLTSPLDAGMADWFGIGRFGRSPNPYWKLVAFTLLPRAHSIGRRIRHRFRATASRVGTAETSTVEVLTHAWAIAAHSPANAPGQGLPYYAFTHCGRHYPGERPWYLRWEAIRREVIFERKRVLDLGTNMGLTPIFALVHGASSATGVDTDAEVLEAAKLIARALGVNPHFECIDLSSSSGWEDALGGADLVFAMTLVRWLPRNRRILAFLAMHRELIYEGHDSLASELERLRSAGFTQVDLLLETERGRHLLYARK